MRELEKNLDGTNLRIGVVLSRFNSDIGDGLLSACTAELLKLGVASEAITIATVPGALETPLILQHMAMSDQYDALIALGAIIRGETYHFEVVANESARGISEVQFNAGIPVANAVLTTEDDDQAIARMHVKGAEAAQVAVEMANLIRAL
ncbi:MAG: 6,7-dimethyl-8-ribityllumazine synthase [Methylotenera sp.]|nr:6,7-dimethyl-8-ribityllumazine synthase [Methylotenera sp.]HPH07139.1 6,7-dimethyl-8-ribityllumazine synthase [Methylotenera sp.]HPM49046.1 6,7-dimethyl-8-ribityllumazine synthase [Methylotenera sp.]HQM87833.1 6,7-dimethyl-8-ribityllumazine synthase [Methylotenera sp.]